MSCPTSLSTFIAIDSPLFVNFQIVRCPASLSTLIAIDLLSYHFLILKLCVVLQFIPHLLQSTWHPIIWEFSNCAPSCISFHIHCNWLVLRSFVNFQIVRLLAPISTFIAIDLLSYHFLILKFALSCNSFHIYCICEFSNCASSCTYFHIHCNRLAILSFSDFEIVRCPASLST